MPSWKTPLCVILSGWSLRRTNVIGGNVDCRCIISAKHLKPVFAHTNNCQLLLRWHKFPATHSCVGWLFTCLFAEREKSLSLSLGSPFVDFSCLSGLSLLTLLYCSIFKYSFVMATASHLCFRQWTHLCTSRAISTSAKMLSPGAFLLQNFTLANFFWKMMQNYRKQALQAGCRWRWCWRVRDFQHVRFVFGQRSGGCYWA